MPTASLAALHKVREEDLAGTDNHLRLRRFIRDKYTASISSCNGVNARLNLSLMRKLPSILDIILGRYDNEHLDAFINC